MRGWGWGEGGLLADGRWPMITHGTWTTATLRTYASPHSHPLAFRHPRFNVLPAFPQRAHTQAHESMHARTKIHAHAPSRAFPTLASGSSRDSKFSQSVAMMLSYWLG